MFSGKGTRPAETGKAQGAIEYLLLIGGAVAVAVIVLVVLLGVSTEVGGSTELQAVRLSAATAKAGWYGWCVLPSIPGESLVTLTLTASEGFEESQAESAHVPSLWADCEAEEGELTFSSQVSGPVDTLTYSGRFDGSGASDCDGGYMPSSSSLTIGFSSQIPTYFYAGGYDVGPVNTEGSAFSEQTVTAGFAEGFPVKVPGSAAIKEIVNNPDSPAAVCVIWHKS